MQLSETMSSKSAIRRIPEKQENVNAPLNAKTLKPHAQEKDCMKTNIVILLVILLPHATYVDKDILKVFSETASNSENGMPKY